ncbi:MAG: hypothetical protein WCW01_05315 [Gammaproteobacteria bacterium]|jgi:hypothetical protein
MPIPAFISVQNFLDFLEQANIITPQDRDNFLEEYSQGKAYILSELLAMESTSPYVTESEDCKISHYFVDKLQEDNKTREDIWQLLHSMISLYSLQQKNKLSAQDIADKVLSPIARLVLSKEIPPKKIDDYISFFFCGNSYSQACINQQDNVSFRGEVDNYVAKFKKRIAKFCRNDPMLRAKILARSVFFTAKKNIFFAEQPSSSTTTPIPSVVKEGGEGKFIYGFGRF